MNPLIASALTELTDRDLAIMDDVEQFRLLTTKQLQQLHFPVGPGGHSSQAASTKAAMRALERLERNRILSRLSRRIGGVRHGSSGYIWQLTSYGDRLQRARRGETGRRRYIEPGGMFVEHTLAVTDATVTLRKLAREGRLEVLQVDGEPASHRQFTGPHGVPQTLKPDLYAVTATGAYEDSHFIEIDRDTEHIPAILRKCRLYAAYAATGTEQHRRGVFPAVLWVVPTPERAKRIADAIRDDRGLPDALFQVITTDQLASHLTAAEDSP